MLEPRQTTDSPPETPTAAPRREPAPAQTATRGALNPTPSRDLDDLLGRDDLSDEPLEPHARPRRWWLVATGAALLLIGIAAISLLVSVTERTREIGIRMAVGVSAVIGVGFGFYPALRASRLDPTVALRGE